MWGELCGVGVGELCGAGVGRAVWCWCGESCVVLVWGELCGAGVG